MTGDLDHIQKLLRDVQAGVTSAAWAAAGMPTQYHATYDGRPFWERLIGTPVCPYCGHSQASHIITRAMDQVEVSCWSCTHRKDDYGVCLMVQADWVRGWPTQPELERMMGGGPRNILTDPGWASRLKENMAYHRDLPPAVMRSHMGVIPWARYEASAEQIKLLDTNDKEEE